MTDKQNRVKRVPLYREIIEPLFRGDATAIEGLPDDATLVRCYDNPARAQHVLIFRSEEFEPVEEGEKIPELVPEIVNQQGIPQLIDCWRQDAEQYLTQENDPVYERGRALSRAIQDLERYTGLDR